MGMIYSEDLSRGVEKALAKSLVIHFCFLVKLTLHSVKYDLTTSYDILELCVINRQLIYTRRESLFGGQFIGSASS